MIAAPTVRHAPSARRLTLAGLLERAAMLLERDGWGQGIERDGPKRCAAQAIRDSAAHVAAPTEERYWDLVGAAICAVRQRVVAEGGNLGSLAWWNDRPGRTREDVTRIFRRTAHWLRQPA